MNEFVIYDKDGNPEWLGERVRDICSNTLGDFMKSQKTSLYKLKKYIGNNPEMEKPSLGSLRYLIDSYCKSMEELKKEQIEKFLEIK